MIFILLALGIPLITLIAFALIKRKRWLTVCTILVLQFTIFLREDDLSEYARQIIWEKGQQSLTNIDIYRNGVFDLLDYSKITSVYVYLVLLIILILCYRGFKESNNKSTKTEPS